MLTEVMEYFGLKRELHTAQVLRNRAPSPDH